MCTEDPALPCRVSECYDVQFFGMLNEECRTRIKSKNDPSKARKGGCGITCIAPSAVGEGVTVIVTRGTQRSNYEFMVNYEKPTISSISDLGGTLYYSSDGSKTNRVPTSGLAQIILRGTNFGRSISRVSLGQKRRKTAFFLFASKGN